MGLLAIESSDSAYCIRKATAELKQAARNTTAPAPKRKTPRRTPGVAGQRSCAAGQAGSCFLCENGSLSLMTLCELLTGRPNGITDQVADFLADVIVRNWGSWASFDEARRRDEAEVHPQPRNMVSKQIFGQKPPYTVARVGWAQLRLYQPVGGRQLP
jgi:hypothetical protein